MEETKEKLTYEYTILENYVEDLFGFLEREEEDPQQINHRKNEAQLDILTRFKE